MKKEKEKIMREGIKFSISEFGTSESGQKKFSNIFKP